MIDVCANSATVSLQRAGRHPHETWFPLVSCANYFATLANAFSSMTIEHAVEVNRVLVNLLC